MKDRSVFLFFSLGVICALMVGCNGGGGGGGGFVPSASAGGSSGKLVTVGTGQYMIDLSGGTGDTSSDSEGDGGDGDDFYVEMNGALGLHIGTAGTIDTRFDYPADPPTCLGVNPLIVTADLTIDVYENQAAAQAAVAEGGYYLVVQDSNIYERVDVGGEPADEIVDAIEVKAGVTLTLGLNWNGGGNSGEDTAYITVDEDIKIAGTLTVKGLDTGDVGAEATIEDRHGAPAISRDKGGLEIHCAGLIVTRTGRIDTSGGDYGDADERGGDGGFIYVDAPSGGIFLHGIVDASGGNGDGTGIGGDGGRALLDIAWGIDFESDGIGLNTGSRIDCSGGNGSAGGHASSIEFDVDSFVYNTGMLKANGGTGTTGDGGDSDYVELYSDLASVFNSGKIEAKGGGSTDGAAGDGGELYFYGGGDGYIGQILNSGALDASGGSSTNGDGGDAGFIYMESYGGDIRNVASITARGGSAPNGLAGDGDYLDFNLYEGYDYEWGEYTTPGDVVLCGNIDLSGGDGEVGGDGGYVDIYNDDYDYEYDNDYGVFLHGYRLIDCSGGDGANGGDAGWADMYVGNAEAHGEYYYMPPGPVTLRCDFDLSGGDGTNGIGGDGDDFIVEHEDDEYFYDETSVIIIRGDVDCSGGDGTDGGGDADYTYVYGYALVDWAGNVDLSGGDGTGTNASGGDGGDDHEVWSSFDIRFSGRVDLSGGDATGTAEAGDGGEAYLSAGGKVIDRGMYDASGGDADDTDGIGGYGGHVEFFSETTMSDHVGAIDVSGGDGATPGEDGTIVIDRTDYTP